MTDRPSNPRKSQLHLKLQVILGQVQELLSSCENEEDLDALVRIEDDVMFLLRRHPT